MKAFSITTSGVGMLLALTACGAVGVQSGSQSTTVGVAGTPSAATASTTDKSTGIADRDGSRQIRDCLHCAP